LQSQSTINFSHTFMIRQLEPTPVGLPLQLYIFTKTTEWVRYEEIQADIFDHLLAAIAKFELKVFQYDTAPNTTTS